MLKKELSVLNWSEEKFCYFPQLCGVSDCMLNQLLCQNMQMHDEQPTFQTSTEFSESVEQN